MLLLLRKLAPESKQGVIKFIVLLIVASHLFIILLYSGNYISLRERVYHLLSRFLTNGSHRPGWIKI